MRKNGKKYGFDWEGPKDPVHFDFQNNEDRGKYLAQGGEEAEEAGDAAKNFGGQLLQTTIGKVGDPEQVDAPDQVNPPQPNPQQEAVNEQPVNQTTKNGDGAVIPYPIVVPSPTKVIMGPSGPQQLDPDIQRHYVVDQFSKATRVEVAYV